MNIEEEARRVYIACVESGRINLSGEAHKMKAIKDALRKAMSDALADAAQIEVKPLDPNFNGHYQGGYEMGLVAYKNAILKLKNKLSGEMPPAP